MWGNEAKEFEMCEEVQWIHGLQGCILSYKRIYITSFDVGLEYIAICLRNLILLSLSYHTICTIETYCHTYW